MAANTEAEEIAAEAAAREPVEAAEAAAAQHAAPLTPGARIAAAREQRGVSLEQVGEALHLDLRLLKALEADQYDAFDAPVYARGFLRKVAGFLELDPQVLLDGYDQGRSAPATPTLIPRTSARIEPRDLSMLRLPLIGAGLLAVVATSVWWFSAGRPGLAPAVAMVERWTGSASAPDEAVEAVGTAGVGSVPIDPAGTIPVDDVPMAAGDPAGPTEQFTPSDAESEVALPVATPVAATQPVRVVAAPPPTVGAVRQAPAAAAGGLALHLRGDCWLDVRGADGRRLQVGIARSGQVLRFAGAGPWSVVLGDARNVAVHVGNRELVVPGDKRNGPVARFVVAADGTLR